LPPVIALLIIHICYIPRMYFRRFSAFLTAILCLCFSAASIENADRRFERIGPFGGDVRSLLMDSGQPETVYLGTSNGMIFKSADSGKSWVPLYPGIGRPSYVIDALVQHPGERNHIYAGAWDLHSEGGGLFESMDAGATWSEVMFSQTSSAVRGLSICKSKPEYMIAGTLSGPFVSADGGRSWKRVAGSDIQRAESVAIDPIDHRILYVGTWRLAYKSTDFGRTWNLVDTGVPLDSDVFSIAIDQANPAVMYSSACSGVYRSTNQARTWTRLRLVPDRFAIRAQVVYLDPVDRQKVYSGTTEGLFLSNNDGQHWTRITGENITVNAIQVSPADNRRILIGTEYQGVLLSEDGGKTWKESSGGFIHQQISWIVPDPGNPGGFVAGLASGRGGLYAFSAQGRTWAPSQIREGMRILSYLILPKSRGRLAGTSQGLFWQANAAAPWSKVKGLIGKRTVYSLQADPGNQIIYAGTDQGIYRSTLSAMEFRLPPGYRLSPQVWCITSPPAETGAIYAGSSLGLLRSWDRGMVWNTVSSYGLPARAPIYSIAVSPLSKDQLFAATSVGLYASSNAGTHWRRVGDGLGGNIPSLIFLDESGKSILAADGNSGGVFYSTDGGQNWERFAMKNGSPVTCLAIDPQKPSLVYVGTKSDGVYRLNLP
jgi:photosystem II stability/assembly factor-like uncharacterized protein